MHRRASLSMWILRSLRIKPRAWTSTGVDEQQLDHQALATEPSSLKVLVHSRKSNSAWTSCKRGHMGDAAIECCFWKGCLCAASSTISDFFVAHQLKGVDYTISDLFDLIWFNEQQFCRARPHFISSLVASNLFQSKWKTKKALDPILGWRLTEPDFFEPEPYRGFSF